ncbi:MAG: hypothetical protein QOE70_74 [Chthoniobacter sp.]|jgi:spermidine synthase|nr:hypothetical protein [Chthoniobacter sp.]
MKPFRTLAQTHTPDGSRFTLHEHDGDYFLKLNGRQLMSTTATTSELLLAQTACQGLGRHGNPTVLIGGLGLGFSLKQVLALIGPAATVQVAELLPEVVAWNREFLGPVNGALLNDPRVQVLVADVFEVIRRAGKECYDAILLDVDNGPTSLVQAKNSRLYDRHGFGLISRALKPAGRVAFWSAGPEPAFVQSLARAGFKTKAYPVKAHDRAKRCAHVIYLAELDPDPDPGAPEGRKPSLIAPRNALSKRKRG